MHDRADIGQDEKFCIVNLRSQPLVTLIRKVNAVLLFINNEISHIRSLVHTAVVVLHINLLSGKHTCLDTRL